MWQFSLIYLLGSSCIWYAIDQPLGHYDVDSWGYSSIAEHFVSTGTLTDPHHPESAPIQPVGYPFFVGACFRLFGIDIRPVLMLQITLMCIALMLCMMIAKRIAGTKVAYITGIFFLLTLGFYIYPQLLLAESLLVVMLLCMLDRYIFFVQSGDICSLSIAGLAAGISMIIKPTVMLCILFLCACTYYVARIRQQKSHMRAFVSVAILLFSFTVPTGLYIMRNYMHYGYVAFAPMMQLNMYQIFLSKVMGSLADTDPQEIIETQLRFKGQHNFDTSGWDDARKLLIHHIQEYPLLCARIWLLNVAKSWLGLYVTQFKKMIEPTHCVKGHSYFDQTGDFLQRMRTYIEGGTSYVQLKLLGWYECIWGLLRLILAFIGFIFLYKKDRFYALFLLSICIAFSLPTGIDGCCRYRIVFEPVLLLFSAIGLLKIYEHFFNNKKEQRYGVFG